MATRATHAAQLREIFGERLKMLAAFGGGRHLCAVVQSLTLADLDRCAAVASGWKTGERTAPLLIPADELTRALDAFPLELNEIISTRQVLDGEDLFAAMSIPSEDLRRACEYQARSHLLHLREGYVEASGQRKAIAALVTASSVPFRALLANVGRLDGWSADALLERLGLAGFDRSFPASLSAAERLVEYVDRWKHA
jgi:hypothetical protein